MRGFPQAGKQGKIGRYNPWGGWAMDMVKSICQYMLTPSGIIALCFVTSFPLMIIGRRIGKYLLLLGILGYFAFGSSPLSLALLGRLENRYSPLLDMHEVEDIDTVVVLTGAAWKDPLIPSTSQVGEVTLSRLLEAIRLFHGIPSGKILISGGALDPAGEDVPVSQIVGELAREMGIPKEKILLETKSTNTYENGVEVKKILGEKRFILVTSASHLPRAIAVFRKLGLSPIPAPADFRAIRSKPRVGGSTGELVRTMISALPSSDNLAHSERALHEYVGFVWYWLRGWI
jgi:uncharacterized SAM-binding protein YcdF (DUF218 family)